MKEAKRSNQPYESGNGHYRGVKLIELTQGEAQQLAGIFEIGGGISLVPTTSIATLAGGYKAEYESVKGIIYFSDSDAEKMAKLPEIFGGKVGKHPKERSWRWAAYGHEAASLLAQIEPYSPHRKPEIEAFVDAYDDNKDMDERICIARAFKEFIHTPRSYPEKKEYEELVENDNFAIGTYLGRGIDYEFRDDSPLRFWSQNLTLLAALGDPYGLEPYPIINDRWERKPDARVPVSFRLEMNAVAKQDFLRRVANPSDQKGH